ncbi:MAG: peptidoglycan editing factor PgeF [Prevotella sp.]|nr:peptidoglycan editing factor PgeF [Prevotella sp.]
MITPRLTYYDLGDGVTAFSTTRHGGMSRGNYAEFNINRYCGDDEAAVTSNLMRLSAMLGISPEKILMPHQTHGTYILPVADEFLSLNPKTKAMLLENTDALVTDVRGVCIGVSTADCIPVLLYDPVQKVSAAVHAGWRGTVACIVVKTVQRFCQMYGSKPSDIRAVVGPGISLDNFEVGDEVYQQFAEAGFDMSAISRRYDKWHIDLPECNRLQLLEAGLKEANIHASKICTYDNNNDFFSARRQGIMSGRIYTGIMMK